MIFDAIDIKNIYAIYVQKICLLKNYLLAIKSYISKIKCEILLYIICLTVFSYKIFQTLSLAFYKNVIFRIKHSEFLLNHYIASINFNITSINAYDIFVNQKSISSYKYHKQIEILLFSTIPYAISKIKFSLLINLEDLEILLNETSNLQVHLILLYSLFYQFWNHYSFLIYIFRLQNFRYIMTKLVRYKFLKYLFTKIFLFFYFFVQSHSKFVVNLLPFKNVLNYTAMNIMMNKHKSNYSIKSYIKSIYFFFFGWNSFYIKLLILSIITLTHNETSFSIFYVLNILKLQFIFHIL